MKTHLKAILCFLPLSFVACSGSNLVTSSDSSTNATGTTKSVTIQSIHHPEMENGEFPNLTQQDGSKMFSNNQGVMIHLKKALLSWGSFHLISADGDDCTPGTNIALTLLTIEDVMSADLFTKDLGVSNVADVFYCQYQVRFIPAGAASAGIDDHPELDGYSVLVSGTWNDGVNQGNFEIKVTEEILQTLKFKFDEGGSVMEHAFHFHEGETERSLLFGNKYNRWFDDLDFSETTAELEEQLITNITANVHQHLGDHHGSSDDSHGDDDSHEEEGDDHDHGTGDHDHS